MRRAVFAGLITCCAALTWAVQDADARPGQDKTNIYFSDASFREPVGEELVLNCYRAVHLMIWGVRTNYYQVDSSSCDDGAGGGFPSPSQCFVFDGKRNVSVPCG